MSAVKFFANRSYAEIDDLMNIEHRPHESDLFELNMNLIDIGNGQAIWGGSLQNVNNGEKRFFMGWSGLFTNLQEMLTPSAQLEVLKALLRTKEAYR